MLTFWYDRVTIHHSTNLRMNPHEELRNIQTYHQSLGWGDIGYHYAVDRYGKIYSCRSMFYRGCHVEHGNTGNLGVVLLGNFMFDNFPETPHQYHSLIRLVGWFLSWIDKQGWRVYCHSDFNSTACPGGNISKHIAKIRKNINYYLKSGHIQRFEKEDDIK